MWKVATVTADHLAGLSIQGGGPPYRVPRESTLRYYERIGLIGPVPRVVTSSSHRRYAVETVDTLEALPPARGPRA